MAKIVRAAVKALRKEEQALVKQLDRLRARITDLSGMSSGRKGSRRGSSTRARKSTQRRRSSRDLARREAPLGEVPREEAQVAPTSSALDVGVTSVLRGHPAFASSRRVPRYSKESRACSIAERPGSRSRCLLLSGCILYAPVDLGALGSPGELEESVVLGSAGPKIVLVEITGRDQRRGVAPARWLTRRSGRTWSSRPRTCSDRAAEDPDVAAILLRINTPGGSVSASDTLYHEIELWKTEQKRAGGRVPERTGDVGRLLRRDGGRPRRGAPERGDRLDRRRSCRGSASRG